MGFTENQLKAIHDPVGNLLVSAAAGSGKTMVLVERIINKVTDPENPIDIDEILIVTFTNNSAADMKSKIEKALESAVEKNPTDEHLQKQLRCIHFAHISTIDSFCQSLVRRYCHFLNIDPGFRVSEQSEEKALLLETIGEVIEEAYDSEDPAFLDLVARYGGRYGDRDIENLIKAVVEKSESYPFPERWIDEKLRMITEDNDPIELYAEDLFRDSMCLIKDIDTVIKVFLPKFAEPGMPPKFQRVMQADAEIVADLTRAGDIRELAAKLAALPSWQKCAPRGGEKEVTDPAKEAVCSDVRDKYKKTINAIASRISQLGNGAELMRTECGPAMSALCSLALKVMRRYEEKQTELGAYSFSALEHLALRVLLDEDGKPTEAAAQLSREYAEIMIDEYQDSNMLQEYILSAVTNPRNEIPNMFMVGDVKQSIYRFRKARPELFVSKYETFSDDTEENRSGSSEPKPVGYRIDLQDNFRSREQVTDAVNQVFRMLMHKAVGGVEYDSRAELRYGHLYDPYLWNSMDYRSELLIAEQSEDPVDAEAEMITQRICELTDPVSGLRLVNLKTGEEHIAQYRDVLILFRSMKSSLVEKLKKSLQKRGIPVCVASEDGIFEAVEVSVLMSLLQVLDNPFQDIPLAEVLMSQAIGFSADDLGVIAAVAKKSGTHRHAEYMQTVIRRAVTETGGLYAVMEPIRDKCIAWIALYDRLRSHSAYVSAAEILEEFLQLTGFSEFISALPDGAVRKQRMQALISRAYKARSNGAGSVNAFAAYCGNKKKLEDSSGLESAGLAAADAVQFMTIHKSKGLEYPIVFVADTNKEHNMQDFNGNLLIHDDLGFGPQILYPKARRKVASLAKNMIKVRGKQELIGEELRLLYVAMTRAKEKLIVTGRISSVDRIGKRMGSRFRYTCVPAYADLVNEKGCYFNLVLQALFSGCSPEEIDKVYDAGNAADISREIGAWSVRVCPVEPKAAPEEVQKGETEDPKAGEPVPEVSEEKETHSNPEETRLYETYREQLRKYTEYEYPHSASTAPVKVSVSAVKKQKYLETLPLFSAEDDDGSTDRTPELVAEQEALDYIQPEPVPAFAKHAEKLPKKLSGAEFGTLCHRVLQLHDYNLPATAEAFAEELAGLAANRQITEAEAALLSAEPFLAFFDSDIGQRMRKAFLQGNLDRERSFIMSMDAGELYPGTDASGTVLVQGKADAFFEEDDGIVIVDYKTDRVDAKNGEKELADRYAYQLELYARAVARGTGKTVKETVIYSFALNKSINIGYNISQ